MVAALSVMAVAVAASLLGLGILTGDEPSRVATDMTPAVAITGPPDTTPQQTEAEDTAQTDRANYWAEILANWAGFIDSEVLQEGLTSEVIDYWETTTPMPEGGSLSATVDAADAQLTLEAEFQALAEGEYREDPSWQTEVAASMADGVTTAMGTSFFTDSPTDEQGVPATFFYTEATDGSRLVTAVSEFGLIVVRAEAVDPSRLPDKDRLNAIATGMTSTAYDLMFVFNPDDPLPSTEIQTPPSPTEGEWIQLDTDVWIASVTENSDDGENTRVWIKTDTQPPTAAPSADTRSLLAKAGDSDLVVVVFDIPGEPRPEIVTARWSDGRSEAGDLVWNEEQGIGLARLEWHEDAELEAIDGP
jgi:hypothetical protein